MISTVKYCKRHHKQFKSKDGCPICEAVRNLRGQDYERKTGLHQNNQDCEQEDVCGGRCQNKDCAC